MAIAYIKEVGHTTPNVSGTTFTIPVTNAPGAGNLLVAAIANPSFAVTGVTDSRGNTWTVDKSQTGAIATCIASTVQDVGTLQAGDTITVTVGGSLSSGKCAATCNEFSGATKTVDQTASNNATVAATTRDSGTTAATTNANDLVFAAFGVNGVETSFTVGAGYSAPATTFYANTATCSIEVEWQIVSATGTQDATGTGGLSAKYEGVVVVYKAAVSAAGNAPHRRLSMSGQLGIGI